MWFDQDQLVTANGFLQPEQFELPHWRDVCPQPLLDLTFCPPPPLPPPPMFSIYFPVPVPPPPHRGRRLIKTKLWFPSVAEQRDVQAFRQRRASREERSARKTSCENVSSQDDLHSVSADLTGALAQHLKRTREKRSDVDKKQTDYPSRRAFRSAGKIFEHLPGRLKGKHVACDGQSTALGASWRADEYSPGADPADERVQQKPETEANIGESAHAQASSSDDDVSSFSPTSESDLSWTGTLGQMWDGDKWLGDFGEPDTMANFSPLQQKSPSLYDLDNQQR